MGGARDGGDLDDESKAGVTTDDEKSSLGSKKTNLSGVIDSFFSGLDPVLSQSYASFSDDSESTCGECHKKDDNERVADQAQVKKYSQKLRSRRKIGRSKDDIRCGLFEVDINCEERSWSGYDSLSDSDTEHDSVVSNDKSFIFDRTDMAQWRARLSFGPKDGSDMNDRENGKFKSRWKVTLQNGQRHSSKTEEVTRGHQIQVKGFEMESRQDKNEYIWAKSRLTSSEEHRQGDGCDKKLSIVKNRRAASKLFRLIEKDERQLQQRIEENLCPDFQSVSEPPIAKLSSCSAQLQKKGPTVRRKEKIDLLLEKRNSTREARLVTAKKKKKNRDILDVKVPKPATLTAKTKDPRLKRIVSAVVNECCNDESSGIEVHALTVSAVPVVVV